MSISSSKHAEEPLSGEMRLAVKSCRRRVSQPCDTERSEDGQGLLGGLTEQSPNAGAAGARTV